jgi:16S rRNA (uracil1498-N3)-methyltransferase
VRHAQVLRVRVGQHVCLFDAAGQQADAHITRIERGRIMCEAGPARALPERASRLSLVLGVPKAPKLDGVVRMTTELGVHALRLAHTEHSVPRLSADSPKLERLRRVAREACAQSGQPRVPEVVAPEALVTVAAAAPKGALRVVFWEQSTASLDHVFPAPTFAACRDVWAVVGPEGGLGQDEVAALTELGYRDVGLGDAILRVDTAVLVASTLLLDRMGLLGR